MTSSTAPQPKRRPGFAALLFAVLSILVLIGIALWFWFRAPNQVPSHFGADGQPDDWSSKGETLAILVPLGVGIAVLFSIRWIWEKLPMRFLNIPHKEYWLQHGQRGYLFDCLMEFMRITAGALALLFAMILVGSLSESLGTSQPDGLMLLLTPAFLVIVALAMWNLYHQLKPRD
ncbi:DUF1648 domain-containing protein [Brevibacterium marinum]|uniref:Putative membrane protein n=1 Tax=Brevibacterium marinum TaxID=418643 RepID=A0A846RRE2_9MICO|nr:putative membrane protein [Brevibacterium marinum]